MTALLTIFVSKTPSMELQNIFANTYCQQRKQNLNYIETVIFIYAVYNYIDEFNIYDYEYMTKNIRSSLQVQHKHVKKQD